MSDYSRDLLIAEDVIREFEEQVGVRFINKTGCAKALVRHNAKLREYERAKILAEVKSKMISFHTDKIFQYGTDIIEAKADAFDELKDWLEKQSKK